MLAAIVHLALALVLAPTLQDEVVRLEPGVPFTDDFDVGNFGEGYLEFEVEVTNETVALEVVLTCGKADLDLHVSLIDDLGDDVFWSTGYEVERVVVDFVSEYPLRSGIYSVGVEYPGQPLPVWEGERLSSVPFELVAHLHGARVDHELVLGEPVSAVISSEAWRQTSFRVEVPEDTEALRIDITSTSADLDLRARRGGPMTRFTQVTHEASHAYGRETLVITEKSKPRLRPGTWYVDVIDFGGSRTDQSSFVLHASLGRDPPEDLLPLPEIPIAEGGVSPLARALSSVVELFAGDTQGSGTLISPGGRILTNAHVVSDYAGRPVEEVVVAIPLGHDRPPIESYRAKIVEFEAELDLALLQIERGFYGQELPPGHSFPALRISRDPPGVGQEIFTVGYPWIGGSGGRVSVTVARGIVSGFEDSGSGSYLKTDAEISVGNSGGAALGSRGELVGVPTWMMDDGWRRVSFIVPVSEVPEGWLPE